MKLKKNDKQSVKKVSIQLPEQDWIKIKKYCDDYDMFIGAFLIESAKEAIKNTDYVISDIIGKAVQKEKK